LSEQKSSNKKNRLLSWIIFLPTLIIVLVTIILGMFPILLIAFSDRTRFPREINIFEPGIWMFPILIVSAIVFTTIILHQKNKLPQNLTNLFRFILNLEISHRTAIILLGIMIGSYVVLNVEEVYTQEPWGDFGGVEKILQGISFDKLSLMGFRVIPYTLAVLSMEIFGSYRVAPFIASILCLFFTYLLTAEISKKRFAGIVALFVVLQSENFGVYDTTITYPIMWIMFYLFSLYLIFKIFFASSVSYILSVLSHPLSMAFFPITIIVIAVLDLPKRKKILLISTYVAFIVIAVGIVATEIIPFPGIFSAEGTSSPELSRLVEAYASIIIQFRYDGFIVVFLLPLVVCLFLVSRKGISNANVPLVLIGGIILLISFIPVLTNMQNTPYRILPLVFFFAIGVGTLFSKNINLQNELPSKKS